MKVRITLILALLILPANALASFSDVLPTHPYFDAIEWAKTLVVPAPTPNPKLLIEGYQDGTFRPDNTINRAEFMKIVIDANQKNLGGYSGISITTFFPDVPQGVWYQQHLASAKNMGIVSGYPDGYFRPENSISFAEAAKIIVNAKEVNTYDLTGAIEPRPNEEWYKVYVDYLRNIDAIPPSIEEMDQLVTRAEMVEMMYQISTY